VKRTRWTKLGAAILTAAMLTGTAGADTISYITSTPITSATTDWTRSLPFQKFSPTLGTLDSVEIKLQGGLSTVLTVTNGSASGSSGNAYTHLQFTVQDPGAYLNAPEIDIMSPKFTYTLASGGSTTSGTLNKNGSSDDLYTLAAILAEFTGSGTIPLSASTFTETLLANTGGNTSAGQITQAQLTGTVIYSYTVPEPATLSLLAAGGLSTFLLRRRRR